MGFFQARVLEWIAISSFSRTSRPQIEPRFPALQVNYLPPEPPGKLHPCQTSLLRKNQQLLNSNFEVPDLFSSAQSCPTLFDPMDSSTPGLPVHHQLLGFTQTSIDLVMPSNHLILCCPLLLLLSIFPSIKVFSNESALHIRWPKYWSFSFNISPSNEYSGLISFRMDWLDLLEVQGTLGT